MPTLPLRRHMKMRNPASGQPQKERPLITADDPQTEDAKAAEGYDWWKFKGMHRNQPGAGDRNYWEDVKQSAREIVQSPSEAPQRLNRRWIDSYYAPEGFDIESPVYTYPYRASTATPDRTASDLQLAQDAVANRAPTVSRPRLKLRNVAKGRSGG